LRRVLRERRDESCSRRKFGLVANRGGNTEGVRGDAALREIEALDATASAESGTGVIDLRYMHRSTRRSPSKRRSRAMGGVWSAGKTPSSKGCRKVKSSELRRAVRPPHRRRANGVVALESRRGGRRGPHMQRDRRGDSCRTLRSAADFLTGQLRRSTCSSPALAPRAAAVAPQGGPRQQTEPSCVTGRRGTERGAKARGRLSG